MLVEMPSEIIWSVAGAVVMGAINWALGLKQKQEQLKDDTVKKLEESLDQNSEALLRLKYSLDALEKTICSIPRIEKDLNELHAKVREINAVLPNLMDQ